MELVRVAYADCGSTRDRVSDGDGYLEGAATPPVLGTVAVPGASPPGAAPYSGACSTSSSSGNDGEATALAPSVLLDSAGEDPSLPSAIGATLASRTGSSRGESTTRLRAENGLATSALAECSTARSGPRATTPSESGLRPAVPNASSGSQAAARTPTPCRSDRRRSILGRAAGGARWPVRVRCTSATPSAAAKRAASTATLIPISADGNASPPPGDHSEGPAPATSV